MASSGRVTIQGQSSALARLAPSTRDSSLAQTTSSAVKVFAALARDWRALRQEAEEARTVPFFLPGYRETMARAAALSAIEDLPADMRRLVDTMLAEHEEHRARDRAVRALVVGIQKNRRRWPELGWAARAQGCAVDEIPAHAAWRAEGTALLEEGRRLAEAGDVARHLHAMPGGPAGLESAARALEWTRRLDDARRLEPARRRLGGEAAGLLEERCELEAFARKAHPSGFAPPTVLDGYAGWSARAGEAVERWRGMGGDTAAAQAPGGPGKDEAEDARHRGRYEPRDRARFIVEVMGFDDPQYEARKERTHARMTRIGSVLRMEGRAFGPDGNGAHRQGRRIAEQIGMDLLRRWGAG